MMNETMRQAYMDKMNARLDEWTANFNVAKARAKGVTADIKLSYGKQLEELDRHDGELREMVAKIGRSGLDQFEHLKENAEKAWVNIKHLAQQAAATGAVEAKDEAKYV